jgi:hypothetical protein
MAYVMRQELLDKARKELAEKSMRQIEAETADVWAARSIVAFENYMASKKAALETGKPEHEAEALGWLAKAVYLGHEAEEHAGEAGTADAIRAAVSQARGKAGLPEES